MSSETGPNAPSTCNAPSAPQLVLDNASAASLHVSGDDLVFIDTEVGEGIAVKGGGIRRVASDGTGSTLLYTAPAEKRIIGLVADATNIYFLQNESVQVIARSQLYRLAKAGGPAERLSPTSEGYAPELAKVFAVDATSVYVAAPQRIVRIAIADGTETLIAMPNSSPTDDQLLGTDVWYSSGSGIDGIYKVPAAASSPSEVRIGSVTCGPYAVSATKDGIFCGVPGGVIKFDLNGSNEQWVARALALENSSLAPSLPDGDFVYIYGEGSNEPRTAIYRLPTAGGTLTPVACNRHRIAELAFGPSALFWIESMLRGGTAVNSIYRLAK